MASVIDAERLLKEPIEPAKSQIDVQRLLSTDIRTEGSALARSIGQAELGQGGLPLGARFTVGAANSREEALTRFKSAFPRGDLAFRRVTRPASVPGVDPVEEDVLLFREDASQPYKPVDANLFRGETGENPVVEAVGDVIDIFAEDIGAIIGEEAALTQRAKGAVSLLGKLVARVPVVGRLTEKAITSRPARGAGGAAAGETVKQEIDVATGGTGDDTAPEQALAGGGGTIAGMTVGSLINAGRGAGFNIGVMDPAQRRGAKKGVRASGALDLPPLTAPQITDNPFIRKLAGQAGAVLPTLERYMIRQKEAAVGALNALRRNADKIRLRDGLAEIHKAATDAVLDLARRITKPMKMSEGGSSLQTGVAEYDDFATATVDESYRHARDVDTPEFNLGPIEEAIQEVQDEGQFSTRPDIEGDAPGVGRAIPIHPTVGTVIEDLQRLDPNLTPVGTRTGIIDGTDQLRFFQQRLWDIANIPPHMVADPDVRAAARQARIILRGLQDTLENPRNADPEFLQRWKVAGEQAKQRFDTLEKLAVIMVARTETPAQLARRLAQPGQVDNLLVLRETVPNQRFSEFQDAFKSQLIEEAGKDPNAIRDRLRVFDQETLDVLMSPADQQVFRLTSEGLKRVNQPGIQQVLERQSRDSAVIDDLVNRSETAAIDELANMVERVGKESPVGKATRAAVLDGIYKDVVSTQRGIPTINDVALGAKLRAYRDTGALRFLTPTDIKNMVHLKNYMQFVRSIEDTGSSLQAGEAVAGVRSFSLSAFTTILENIGTANILMSPSAAKFLVGDLKEPKPFRIIQSMVRMLAFSGDDLEERRSITGLEGSP